MSASPHGPDTAPLAVHLFGGLQVRRLGQTLSRPFVHQKTASLFAYLVLHPRRTSDRSFLAGTFWPDVDEEKARQSLRGALTDIRKLLEPLPLDTNTLLVSAQGTLHLNLPPGCWVDVWEFEQAVDESTRVPHASEVWFHALESAVRVYGGPLLPDHGDEWCLLLREELQQRMVTCLHDLTHAGKEGKGHHPQGGHARAAEWARKAVAIDASDEESHRDLMWLYTQMGERARALRQYHECREALREMAAAPDEKTLALYQRIRVQRLPRVRARERWPKELDYPDLGGPLVGRDRELGRLQRSWDRARSGRGGLVLLTGEAGIGRSRLGQRLLQNVAAAGGLALCGEAYPSESHTLYQPLIDPLRRALQLIEEQRLTRCAPVWMRQVARLLPEIGHEDVDLAPPEAESPGLLEGLTRFFLHLSEQRPVYLFLDDLQWADAATGQFLHYLGRRMHSAHLLLVGACREGEVADSTWLRSWVTEMAAQRLMTSLPLARLGEEEVLTLLAALAGGQASERFLRPLGQRLWKETQGNPLFVREQLRALFEEGWLVLTEEGRWGIAPERRGELVGEGVNERTSERESDVLSLVLSPSRRLPPPETVQRVVAQRMARLREEERHLLACAAVFGRRFTLETLRRVVGWELEPTLSAVERLLEAELLQAVAEPASLDFRHNMVREVVYESLGAVRRPELHRRVGEALEAIFGIADAEWTDQAPFPNWFRHWFRRPRPSPHRARGEEYAAELAGHFDQAAPLIGPEKAAYYHYVAGRRARALGTYAQALESLRAAQSRLLESPPNATRLAKQGQILEQMAPAYLGTGQHEAGRRVLGEYIALCEKHRYPQGIARGYTLIGQMLELYIHLARDGTIEEMYERAIAVCGAHDLNDEIRYPRSHLAFLLAWKNADLDRAEALARVCLNQAEAHTDPLLLQRLYTTLMWVEARQGRWEAMMKTFQASLACGGPFSFPLDYMLGDIEESCHRRGEASVFVDLCREMALGYAAAGLEAPLQQWHLAPTSLHPTPGAPVLREEFGATVGHSALRWQEVRGGKVDRTSRPGWLGLSPTEGFDLWPETNLNAPRLMVEAPSDFIAQTRVDLGNQEYLRAGLLLWQDEQHFVRLELWRPPAQRVSVRMEACVAADFRLVGRGQGDSPSMWLRLERVAEEVRGLCSPDGEQWLVCGRLHFPKGGSAQTGIMAITQQPGRCAWFDAFLLWSLAGNG